MIGSISVSVKNKKNNYTFTLNRNITILCGDSGRGKTTLFEMIYEFNRFGKNSGATVVCDVPVIALTGDNWEERLSNISSSIVVIDEDSQFINSHDFAKKILKTDNYYLLITRNYLSQLPYSVEEIYEIKGNKNKKFVRVYSHIDRMYDSPSKKTLPFAPEVIIVEDSKSGYQLFSKIANELGIECISSNGKANIYNTIEKRNNKSALVVADGAAFGAEIGYVVKMQRYAPSKIAIYLPESFEWILLKSGIVCDPEEKEIENPDVDSSKFSSWERYFYEYLVEKTKDKKYLVYNKSTLADYYLTDASITKIKGVMNQINLE